MLFPLIILRVQFILIFIGFALSGFTQKNEFKKLDVYTRESHELKNLIRSHFKKSSLQLYRVNANYQMAIRNKYVERRDLLLKRINSNGFLKDEEIESAISEIQKTIEEANNITSGDNRFLIEKNSDINALCYGEGTFSINIGLLAKLKNQDQLAFIISHELAHYTLDHVNRRIQNMVIENHEGQVKKASLKIASQYKVEESLTSLKNLMYSIGANSKLNEQEADSLGLIYMNKADFNISEAIKTIQILKYSNEPDYPLGDELFDLLIFEDYPFNPDWLRPKLRVYEKKPISFFIFSLDSLKSHPTYDLRISKLENQMVAMQKVEINPAFMDAIRIKSAFASIEAARFQRKLDESLHRALQLYSRNSKSSFARDMIAKNLLLVRKSKLDDSFTKMVAPFTGYYSEELRFINTFLYNIKNKELVEITYRFLKENRLNNKESELYYALLSASCDLSLRKKEKKEVVKEYKTQYPKGKPLNLYLN